MYSLAGDPLHRTAYSIAETLKWDFPVARTCGVVGRYKSTLGALPTCLAVSVEGVQLGCRHNYTYSYLLLIRTLH